MTAGWLNWTLFPPPPPGTDSSQKITEECAILTHHSLSRTRLPLNFTLGRLKNTRPSLKNTGATPKNTRYSLQFSRSPVIFTHTWVSSIQGRLGEPVRQ